MSDGSWGQLSNQAVAGAAVVYFLALLAYIVEWSALRQVSRDQSRARALVTPGGDPVAPPAGHGNADVHRDRVEVFGRIGLMLTGLGVLVHFLACFARGMSADPNRVPWGNMYEFTLTGTFVVALFFMLLQRRYGLAWLGPVVVTFVLTLLMVAVLVLYDATGPLPEALNSYWLVIHVVSAMLATGAFTLGGMLSVAYLLKQRHLARADSGTGGVWARVPSLEKLDLVSYRIHSFGFPVWTFAVLITGPIWAHQAWSSYWNWDPKEVWAFITWVVYAAYLHARTTAGWKGRNAAILALVGTATLWFNFIGINYFSTTSQHSYAGASGVLAPVVPGDPGR